MANQRQIPHLHWQARADGTIAGHWKPSPRLRKLGWTNRYLGTKADEAAVVAAAMAINREVREREALPAGAGPQGPKVWTFGDLVDAYQRSVDWEQLRPSTRREYASQLRALQSWAIRPNGESLPVHLIDSQSVRDLRAAILPVSRFRCANLLRVLRLLFNWGRNNVRQAVRENPTDGVPIPATVSRTRKLDWTQVQAVAAMALAQGHPIAARALRLGFWTMQREADLLGLNRMAYRRLENMDPRDRPALTDARGDVWGFRLRQQKTGTWIDAPMPAFLHTEIEAAFAGDGQWLLPHPHDPASAMPAWHLQRQVRAALNASGFPDHQFRDLRRSGMVFAKDMGALQSNVFAISGHPVMGRKTIADTYMPPDTASACACIAAVLRTLADIDRRNQADG